METSEKFKRDARLEAGKISLNEGLLRRFIDKAVGIQNKAWDAGYAMRKYEFSMAVLNLNKNFVAYGDTKVFKARDSDIERLTIANALAMTEIEEGKRVKPKRIKKSTDDVVKLTLYLRRKELEQILGMISE